MENHSLPPDQHDLLRAFIDEKVRFLVVGGYAFTAHAFMRSTKDIDLWIEPTPGNAARVWSALVKFGAPLQPHDMQQDDFATRGMVYQMGLPPARIDLMTNVADLDFNAAWEQRIESELDGLTVPVIGLDHLILAKLAAGRPQDLLDAQSLQNVKKRKTT